MWEVIRQNQHKSIALFVGLALCLLALGSAIGYAWMGEQGAWLGLIVATVIWIISSLFAITSGDDFLLSLSHAQEVTPEVHQQLFNVTEEMKIAANLPVMPRLFIINDPSPNAFATGVNQNKSAIVVTTGLLAQLNRDELQGVVAHEMGHIVNRDVQFMTYAGVILGSISLLSEVFMRGMYFSSYDRRYRSRDNSRSGGNMIGLVIAIVFAIVAPLMAQLFYFAISRRREYLADATSARLTRYPEGLACALEKIALAPDKLASATKITAPMYIINPLQAHGGVAGFFSTHPPTEERIRILRSMMGQANYMSYQKAFESVKGNNQEAMPKTLSQDQVNIPIRAGDKTSQPIVQSSTSRDNWRTMGDISRTANQFYFLQSACGLRIKIPPEFTATTFQCPRCQEEMIVPPRT